MVTATFSVWRGTEKLRELIKDFETEKEARKFEKNGYMFLRLKLKLEKIEELKK